MKTSTLTINGTTYTLAFDFNSLVDAEQASGLNLMFAINHMDVAGVGQLRGVLFGLLLAQQPEMTLDAAGALCAPDTLPLIARAIGELFPAVEE